MNRKIQSGFTLLELLAAMAIFAIMATMAFGGLSYVLDASEHLDTERKKHQAISLALLRIEDDLSQCRNRPIRLEDGSDSPAFVGREPDARALAEPTIECTRGGQAIVGRQPASDLVRLGYRLNDEQKLVRVLWPVLDRAPQTVPRSQQILSNVESFNVRYYYNKKWHRTWPLPTQSGTKITVPPMPEGIEVTIKQVDQPEIQRLLRING
ncbi:MAG: type II secretion system minor pseudopilin GspJ [Proteobacteria bacterium]|nr:type II secretion system minor pseudopilin GspJ [Pseudomonadota bacterium]